MQVVPNKTVMYKKLRAGEFGNTVRSWASYQALLDSDYRGVLGVRSTEVGGKFLAHVPFDKVPRVSGVYSEMQDDSHIVLQGEVYRSVEGLYLFASKVKAHMRVALREGGKHYWRCAAHAELETAFWPSDYEALLELLAEYADSVVEFSAYDTAVGLIPGRNVVIWEVRNY